MDPDTDTEDTSLSPLERLKGVFDLCDKDKDGLLTVNEFRTLTQQFLGAATQQIEKLICELDPKETGVIDFDNFREGIQSYLSARRDSNSSSLSGSCLSLNGFGDDPIMTSSPNNMSSVHDVHSDATCKRDLSYQFQYNNGSEIELTANCDNGRENHHHHRAMYEDQRLHQQAAMGSNSLSTLELQPSEISPTLMARTLAKKSSHSYLHVSSGGGSGSHDSTPDWTLDDEHDELTDKLQELSSRLEGLEVDLDSSQSQTLHLRRENLSLRERIEAYEERLREMQLEKKRIVKEAAESLKMAKAQLKRKHEEEIEELMAEVSEAQEQNRLLQNSNSVVRSALDESKLECEMRKDESFGLKIRISELEENIKHTKDLFTMERERWSKEQTGHHQEIEAMTHVIEHLRKELVDGKVTKKRNAVATSDIKNGEIMILKKEIKSLQEANDRLSSQLLQHGKQLVAQQPRSLLEELEDAPRNEVMKALKDQEHYNERLKAYIEGLLVTILEKHPELLEVKC